MRVRFKSLAGQRQVTVLLDPGATISRIDGKLVFGGDTLDFEDGQARDVSDDVGSYMLRNPNFVEDASGENPYFTADKPLGDLPGGEDLSRPAYDGQYLILPMMTSPPMRTAIDSMLVEKTLWKGLESSQPPYYGDLQGTYVAVGDPRDEAEQLTPEQQRASAETVLSLDDEHAQTFAFLMAHWMVQNQGREHPQRARVHVNDLLEFRELKRWKRDFKPEQKREERDRILRLSKMWVAVRELVAPRGKKRKTKAVNVFSQLIELAIETDATGVGAPIQLLSDGIPPSSIPYAFRYEPGEWVNSYWGDTKYVGSIFRKVLGYNTRILAERMAMRIALYLSLVPFRAERTVEDLFLGAHLPLPTVQPKRYRDAFDDALGKLRDHQIIASYDYVGGTPPDAGKGWSKAWLETKIRVYPLRFTQLDAGSAPTHMTVFSG